MSNAEARPAGGAWFVRRGDAVRGPYPAQQVTRYAILGRILTSDEVSRDQQEWRALAQYPELLPEALRGEPDEPALARLRRREDERCGFDRRDGCIPSPQDLERRSGRDRRRAEPAEVIHRRRRRTGVVRAPREPGPPTRSVWLVLAGLSAAVTALALHGVPQSSGDGPRCNAAPAPGVHWQHCRLEGLDVARLDLTGANLQSARVREAHMVSTRLRDADLAYAELVGARLAGADLTGASLKGAMLQDSDLRDAALAGADLAFANLYRARLTGADLHGARLDQTVWVDGQVCLPGSVGACRTR